MAIRSNRRWRRSRIPEPVSERGFCTQRLATLNAFEDDHSSEHRSGEDKCLAFPHSERHQTRSGTEARKAPTDTEQQAAERQAAVDRSLASLALSLVRPEWIASACARRRTQRRPHQSRHPSRRPARDPRRQGDRESRAPWLDRPCRTQGGPVRIPSRQAEKRWWTWRWLPIKK
jgi:hypothetical protein